MRSTSFVVGVFVMAFTVLSSRLLLCAHRGNRFAENSKGSGVGRESWFFFLFRSRDRQAALIVGSEFLIDLGALRITTTFVRVSLVGSGCEFVTSR